MDEEKEAADDPLRQQQMMFFHTMLVYMRNTLANTVHQSWMGISRITDDTRAAAAVGDLIHNLPYHLIAPIESRGEFRPLTDFEMKWVNRDVPNFMDKVSRNHFSFFLLFVYLKQRLDVIPPSQLGEVDPLVRECINEREWKWN